MRPEVTELEQRDCPSGTALQTTDPTGTRTLADGAVMSTYLPPITNPPLPVVPVGTAVLPPIAPFVPPANVQFPTIPPPPASWGADAPAVHGADFSPMSGAQMQAAAFFVHQSQQVA